MNNTDYQAIFDRAYNDPANMEPNTNDYGRLVNSLEAVFRADGYDISARELAGDYHNHVVGQIGQTDLATIAATFCASVARSMKAPLRFEVQEIVERKIPWKLQRLSYEIPPLPVQGWAVQVQDTLRRERIRRGAKRYRTLIAEKCARAAGIFRQTAQAAIEERLVEIEREREEMEEAHRAIQGGVEYRERLAYVVAAFQGVAGLEDDGIGQRLDERVAAIRKGIETRRQYAGRVVERCASLSVGEVVSAAVKGHRDLGALWEAALELESIIDRRH